MLLDSANHLLFTSVKYFSTFRKNKSSIFSFIFALLIDGVCLIFRIDIEAVALQDIHDFVGIIAL